MFHNFPNISQLKQKICFRRIPKADSFSRVQATLKSTWKIIPLSKYSVKEVDQAIYD